jgi:hypothetical protein
MLLPGCQCCGACECTRTCTNPHTGAAFAKVFTNYVSGIEAGNLTDGFLTASGDNDTSDPPDGMDGSGPWMQQISGGFSDGGSYGGGNRFPCTYRFSFWRSVRGLGIGSSSTSTALTENVIELTVTAGAVVYPDGTVITPASGAVALATVPLVSGGAGAVDPHSNEGTVSFALQCQNVETTFSIQARIRWNVQKRQHTLYGIVRECYEEGTPCATACSGSAPPNTIYLTISNVTLSGGASISGLAGTYVMSRVNWACNWYEFINNVAAGVQEYFTCTPGLIGGGARTGLQRSVIVGSATTAVRVSFSWADTSFVAICGTGVIKTGTGMALVVTLEDSNGATPFSADGINPMTATCNWKVEA